MTEINGIKLNMSQKFLQNGVVIPVTIVKAISKLPEDEILDKDVIIVGKSKGKGFTGVMKKWGFKGSMKTRGQSDKPRAPGSIGAQTPGKVFKGKKMAGRHGNVRVTIKGLRIVDVNIENNEFMVSGPIPGHRNSKVKVKVLNEV